MMYARCRFCTCNSLAAQRQDFLGLGDAIVEIHKSAGIQLACGSYLLAGPDDVMRVGPYTATDARIESVGSEKRLDTPVCAVKLT